MHVLLTLRPRFWLLKATILHQFKGEGHIVHLHKAYNREVCTRSRLKQRIYTTYQRVKLFYFLVLVPLTPSIHTN